MSEHWHELLINFVALAGILLVWTIVQDYLEPLRSPHKSAIFGLILGGGTILQMMVPFELMPGMIFDSRAALLTCAGFFGGPISAVIAAVATLAYRLFLGGAGVVAGSVSILVSFLIGIAGYHLLGGRPIVSKHIFRLAVVTAPANFLSFFALPHAVWSNNLLEIGLPLIVLNFFATLMAGMVLLHEQRRRQLMYSNLLYRATIEALPDCLNVKDTDGRFLAANPATARLMRAKSVEHLIGKSDFDFYSQAAADAFKHDEQRVISSGMTVTNDHGVVFDRGPTIWLSTLKAPLRDSNGNLMGLITHNRDITEQKRLQQELDTTRERLNDAMSKMSDGMVIFDENGVLLYSNIQYRTFFPAAGGSRVGGEPVPDILRDAVLGRRPLSGAHHTSVPEDGTTAVIPKAGGGWLLLRSSRVKQGVMFIISDVTEQRRAELELKGAEAEYRALFENSVGGIFRATAEGTLLRVNPALARLHGYDTEAEFFEATRDSHADWYIDSGRREEFLELIDRNGLVTDFVSEVRRHRTGERIWISETAWMVHGSNEEAPYCEGTVADVTERRRSEEKLADANRKLEQLASVDGLTGLANRRIFDQTLKQEFARRRRDGTALSIVMIDVDRFKSYNDTYGHLAGDDCLRRISGVFKTVLRRSSDRGCRYGGEELVAILPNTGAEAALIVAEAFRAGVKDLGIEHRGSDLGIVSISAGIATCSGNEEMADVQDLIREADRALYQAKRSGRDRVLPALAA
ncbi:diguanylate cyclase [Pararhizobium sp.]|uniref:diguanylate cyclase n=1 Tax=Pararhizobium sp. TaxID=1977563 RepID=UPI00271CE732|nr:diguanylate cyclase [Pararhizobium sp.]MDO9414678.1 diguanylate cyclase [Pararhizobium sp.]